RLDVAPLRRAREAVDRLVMAALGIVPLGHLDLGGRGRHRVVSMRRGLPDAQLVQRAEVASREDIEREAPALLVRFVRVDRVRDYGRKEADVVRLRLVAPALAVVDVEFLDIEIERRRERNVTQDVAVE